VQGLAAACGRGCADGMGGNDPDCMGAGVHGLAARACRAGAGGGVGGVRRRSVGGVESWGGWGAAVWFLRGAFARC
jgi:hypothetical protein